MNEHVHTWLQAYYDGELQGIRLRKVEEHLDSCAACRAELEQMQSLSVLLRGSPLPEFTPGDRFVAQVALRLPHKAPETGWQRTFRLGWQMVPFGLFGAWAFTQAAFFTVTILALLDQFCTACRDYLAWLSFSSNTIWWAVGLNLAVSLLLGLMYSSWLAGWWVSRRPGQVSPQNGLTQ